MLDLFLQPVALATMFGEINAATFTPIMDGIKELIPIILPAVIGFLAFRKGWSFISSAVRGA